jgi:hypothetical protein
LCAGTNATIRRRGGTSVVGSAEAEGRSGEVIVISPRTRTKYLVMTQV